MSSRLVVVPLVGLILVAVALVQRLGGEPERLLPAPRVIDAGGTFAFAMTQPGSSDPVGWDPCEPIEYAVNPQGEPAGGRALVEAAVERASAASGLAFEDVGETDRRPFKGTLVPFGSRPVVIGWGDEAEFPGLAGAVAGIGGASAEDGEADRRYLVSGGLVLDTAAFTAPAITSSPEVLEAVVLHELAHVIGLGHVGEPMELMFGSNSGLVQLGPGDREGLARLGSIPCR